MRTFPSAFAAELPRRDGSTPIWLLRFTANGADYVLCQDAVTITPWGLSALALVSSWGTLNEGVTGTLADYRIADLSVNLINDPDAVPNLRSLAKGRHLHGVAVSVYLWFDGCADPPQEMYRFRVRDIDLPRESQVTLELQDESIRYESTFPGTVLSSAAYPSADPDDVGKTIPIVFGSVSKLEALAIDAGQVTSLPAAISASWTGFPVSDATGFSAGMHICVDDEEMTIESVSGDALTVTRGVNSTLANSHLKGATIWEKKTAFAWVVADHPLTWIGKIYGRVGEVELDITSVCTKYPLGNHASYPGKAVVTIPGYITAAQAVDLGVDISSLTALDTISVYDTIDVTTGSHAHTEVAPQTVLNTQNGECTASNGQSALVPFNAYLPGGAAFVRSEWSCTVQVGSGGAGGNVNGIPVTVGVGQSQVISGTNYGSGSVALTAGNPQMLTIVGATRTVHYTTSVQSNASPATGVSKTGGAGRAATNADMLAGKSGVVIVGNSVANTLVGDKILVDCISAVTTPQAAISQILGATCTLIGSWPAGYEFNGAITSSRSALAWCHDLARQCRAWFRFKLGVPTLIVRPDTLTPVKSISEIRLSNGELAHGQKLTDVNDVVNSITLQYNRDWSNTSGSEPYKSNVSGTDAPSIAAYGTRERPELFKFDFVTSDTMAASLLDFYLARYAWQGWRHTLEAYLFESALEFGDAVTLSFLAGEAGECIEVGFNPGSGTNIDKIQLTVIE